MPVIMDTSPEKTSVNHTKVRWREHEFLFITILAALKIIGYYWDWYLLSGTPEKDFYAAPYFQNNLPFNAFTNVLLPQIGAVLLLYAAYLGINYFTLPFAKKIILKKGIISFSAKAVWLVLQLLFIAYVLAFGVNVATYYGHPFFYNYGPGFSLLAWLGYNNQPLTNLWAGFDRAVGIIAFYFFLAGVRESIIYWVEKPSPRREYGVLVANQFTASLVIYIALGLFLTTFGLIKETFSFAYLIFIPSAIIVFLSNTYWLFPFLANNSSFQWQVTPLAKGKHMMANFHFGFLVRLLFSTLVCSFLFAIPLTRALHSNAFFLIFFSCWAIHLFLVTPVSWLRYQQQKDKILQLRGVEKELVQSKANLQHLRAQINPHFLFNALNTLYGLALLENSERTAEGIQKLGDMMRFMLHENQQDFIPMLREMEHLQNYLALQKLRTQVSSQITIEVCMPEQPCPYLITPMLLIPLVENAFKHGISFKEKSWIKIKLSCENQQIYFEVRNSVHPNQPARDPEKEISGIGLTNIQERLHLLYNRKHLFNFTSNAKEFVVQLTLQP